MPPFSVLTNDEDREAKAEFRVAGTCFVIVNPESFVNFEEYKGERTKGCAHATSSSGPSSVRRDSTATDQNGFSCHPRGCKKVGRDGGEGMKGLE